MKKILLIIPFLILPLFAKESKIKRDSYPYSIRCYKCYELYKQAKNKELYVGCLYSMARHACELEHNDSKVNEGFMIYKCENLHILYVNPKTGEKK